MSIRVTLRRTVAVAVTVGLGGGAWLTGGGATAAVVAGSPFAVSARIGFSYSGQAGVAVDPSNHNVYVTVIQGVAVVDESGDAHSGQVTATIDTPTAQQIAVDPSNHNVYVLSSDTISVIDESGDAHNGQVTGVIAFPGSEWGSMAVDPTNHNVYADSAHGLVVIDESGDAHNGQVTATINLGSNDAQSVGVVVDSSNHNVYVNDLFSPTVWVIDESGDAHSGQISSTVNLVGSPTPVAVDPSNHNLYVMRYVGGATDLSVIDESGDAHSGQITSTVNFVGYNGVAVDPSNHDFYMNERGMLTVLDESGDADTGQVIGLLNLGDWSGGVGVDSSTHNAYAISGHYSSAATTLSEVTASGAISGVITDSTGTGIAKACLQIETAATGLRIESLSANQAGEYAGTVAPGTYKLLASDCVAGTHATTYYGGADNYDFLSLQAKTVTVTASTTQSGLNVSLPLAGTIQGTVTDTASGLGVAGICAYAIDATQNVLRGESTATTATGRYNIGKLPPGTDRVAFQTCSSGLYPLTYSGPVTVTPGGVMTVNEPLVHA